MRSMIPTLSATAVLAVLLASPVDAAVVPRLDLADLVHSSEVIVQARVTRQWCAWDQDHKVIWTHYSLQVSDVLKGKPPFTVTLSEPGGEVGGKGMLVADVTHYANQEEVVVFLHRTPVGYWRPYGWGQGKYTVRQSASGAKQIYTNIGGMTLLERPKAGGQQRVTAVSPLRRLDGMGLSEFKYLVRGMANGAVVR
jgi:hypothetical protein